MSTRASTKYGAKHMMHPCIQFPVIAAIAAGTYPGHIVIHRDETVGNQFVPSDVVHHAITQEAVDERGGQAGVPRHRRDEQLQRSHPASYS